MHPKRTQTLAYNGMLAFLGRTLCAKQLDFGFTEQLFGVPHRHRFLSDHPRRHPISEATTATVLRAALDPTRVGAAVWRFGGLV